MKRWGSQFGRGKPPPWWPEGERWPPADWTDARRAFQGRIRLVFLIVIGLIFVVGGPLRWILFGASGDNRQDGGPPIGVIILIIAVFVLWRTVRRMAGPIGDVMTAANRVAAGDYTARVEGSGRGEVGRLVESFNAMAARLETNEAQRRTLFADVAHEMRTPLAVVRGNVEGMLDGIYPRDDDHLAMILDETAVMSRLLEDLRTLSMAEVGALRLHPESTDVAALVAEALTALAPRATAAGVALRRHVAPLPPVDLDPVRVREVLDNLLVNALRHTERGGTIWVEVGREGQMVTFTVADTGSGIPAADLPHIFDRFWKSADSGGSGLGLAIAKGLIEAHGGRIRAESQPEWGTTIRFSLPLASGNGREPLPGPLSRRPAVDSQPASQPR